MSTTASGVVDRIRGIDGREVGVAAAIAIVPAFVAFFELVMATREGTFWFLFLPLVGFTWLLYRHERHRNKIASMLFYLAVLAFLSPIAMLFSTYIYTTEQATGAGQFGAALGGGVVVIIFAVVGFFVGVVLYLISNRVAIEKVETVE